jgi:hypothetical protein
MSGMRTVKRRNRFLGAKIARMFGTAWMAVRRIGKALIWCLSLATTIPVRYQVILNGKRDGPIGLARFPSERPWAKREILGANPREERKSKSFMISVAQGGQSCSFATASLKEAVDTAELGRSLRRPWPQADGHFC